MPLSGDFCSSECASYPVSLYLKTFLLFSIAEVRSDFGYEKGEDMSGKAAKVMLTEKQHKILEEIARSKTASIRLVQRCRIILLAFGGALNMTIASAVGLHRVHVGRWSGSSKISSETFSLQVVSVIDFSVQRRVFSSCIHVCRSTAEPAGFPQLPL